MQDKKKLFTALKKIRGLTDKIEKMVDEDAYCMDTAQQVNATIGLLRGLNKEVLRNHLLCCGSEAFSGKWNQSKEAFIDEMLQIFHRSSNK